MLLLQSFIMEMINYQKNKNPLEYVQLNFKIVHKRTLITVIIQYLF